MGPILLVLDVSRTKLWYETDVPDFCGYYMPCFPFPGVSSLLCRNVMSLPFLVPNASCIPPLAKTCRSYEGHSSTCLELYRTLQSSAVSLNPFFKVNTARHELSAASFHSRDLLRQLSKERLVVRCVPISARQSLRRRTPLRLTLARTPSATLRSALRLLHLVRRISSVRIPS